MRYSYGILYLRISATILVVFFHALGYYTYAWPFEGTKVNAYHSFDLVLNQITMPTFFLISAYLFGLKTKKGEYDNTIYFFINKSIRLLVPYFFWSFFQLIVFSHQLSSQSVFYGSLHLWFLLVLFFYFTFFHLTSKIWVQNKKSLLLFILISLIIISSFLDNSISFLSISGFIHYIPFFFCGILLSSKESSHNNIKENIIILLSGLSLLVSFTLFIHINKPINLLIRECLSLLIIYSLFKISFTIPQIKNNVLSKMLNDIDNNSYGIFILHHIIIWWIVQQKTLQVFLNTQIIIAPICLFLFSFITSWGISKIIRRNKYTRLILGEKIS